MDFKLFDNINTGNKNNNQKITQQSYTQDFSRDDLCVFEEQAERGNQELQDEIQNLEKKKTELEREIQKAGSPTVSDDYILPKEEQCYEQKNIISETNNTNGIDIEKETKTKGCKEYHALCVAEKIENYTCI